MPLVSRLRPSVRTWRDSEYSVDLRLEVPLALVTAYRIVYRRRSGDAYADHIHSFTTVVSSDCDLAAGLSEELQLTYDLSTTTLTVV